MATNDTKTAKPAAKSKPANEAKKPASTVGVKQLAEDLGGKSEKSVRAALRRINGGTLPEGQNRYEWSSRSDAAYKEALKKLSSKKADADTAS